MQGQGAFPQARTQFSHAVIIHRLPAELRHATNGSRKILLSLSVELYSVAPLSITQFCTFNSRRVSAVPFVIQSSMRMESREGTTVAPKVTPFGSFRSTRSEPFS